MPGQIQSIHRAATVLRLLADSGRQLGIVDLARELEVPKATAFGIVQTLRAEGLVEQDVASRKYRLGPGLLLMGVAYRERTALLSRTADMADRLAAEIGQTVRVATLFDGRGLVLHHVPGDGEQEHRSDVGLRLPLVSTALGNVLVSEQPDVVLAGACLGLDAESEPDQLLGELAEIAARGWAYRHRDPAPWQSSVAAPIRDGRAGIVAAIAISGPSDRLVGSEPGVPDPALVGRLVGVAGLISRAIERQAG